MKGSNLGVLVIMFMMVGVGTGQSVDPNFVDYSLSDVTPFKHSPPVKMPSSHQIPSPLTRPGQKSPPKFHAPPKDNSCLRKCQGHCFKYNGKGTVKKVCLEACPSKCKIPQGAKSLKNCLLACIKTIPTLSTPAFVAEKNMKVQLDFCYKTCSSRTEIN